LFSDLHSQSQQISHFQDKFSKHQKIVIFKDFLLTSISSVTNVKNKNNTKVSSYHFTQLSRILILSVIKKQIFKQLTSAALFILINQTADSISSHTCSITSSVVRLHFKLKSESAMTAHLQQQSQLTFKAMKNSQSSS